MDTLFGKHKSLSLAIAAKKAGKAPSSLWGLAGSTLLLIEEPFLRFDFEFELGDSFFFFLLELVGLSGKQHT